MTHLRHRNWLAPHRDHAIPFGTVRLSRTTSRTLGTKQRDIVFELPGWRDVDPATLTEMELADLELRHGWRIAREGSRA